MSQLLNRLLAVAVTGIALSIAAVPSGYSDPPAKPSSEAGSGLHQGHEKWKENHQEMAKQLNLTEEQRKQMREAHKTFRTENASEISRLKQERAELKTLRNDPNAKDKRQALRADLKTSYQNLHEKRKASVSGILTPEQQGKWQDMQKKRHDAWKEHHQKNAPGKTSSTTR